MKKTISLLRELLVRQGEELRLLEALAASRKMSSSDYELILRGIYERRKILALLKGEGNWALSQKFSPQEKDEFLKLSTEFLAKEKTLQQLAQPVLEAYKTRLNKLKLGQKALNAYAKAF
ncbi:hypothetical protein [Thermodesulfatator atlanticus]|uniref:hypothetical protein n=1 Tax=Thermodesulfatator atlanticus TaxID=501497 RepID=UPI0003B78163|nr:hypothetical protein [Thermodesulfatator atlanticus]